MISLNQELEQLGLGRSFQALVDVLDPAVSWVRLWTGRNTGQDRYGGFVDTSGFNKYGRGWIQIEDLPSLAVTQDQIGHDEFWIRPEDGEWSHAELDFVAGVGFSDVQKLQVDQSYREALDFSPLAADWYRLYVDGERVSKEYAKGWVQAGELSRLLVEQEHVQQDRLWWKPHQGEWQSRELSPEDEGRPFAELVSHDPEWLRIWTGYQDGEDWKGSFIDASHIDPEYQNGWIRVVDLEQLTVNVNRAEHEKLWIKQPGGKWLSKSFEFEAPAADEPSLQISVLDPGYITADQGFSLQVQVSETAGAATENLALRLELADLYSRSIDVSDVRLSELEGNSAEISFDGLELEDPGSYTLRAAAWADNAQETESVHEAQVVPEFPGKLDVLWDDISADRTGSSIQVQAWTAHFGPSAEAVLTLEQGGTSRKHTLPLQAEEPVCEPIEHTFEHTGFLDPGPVQLSIAVEEEGRWAQESKTLGLFESEQDFEWQWADTERSPFNLIGQVVSQQQEGEDLQYGVGTGFLISPRHVMTNAHVLTGDDQQGLPSGLQDVDFFLGRNGASRDQEQDGNRYQGREVSLQQEEWEKDWPREDKAIVELKQEVDLAQDQEHFHWFWNSRDEDGRDLSGREVAWSGYPNQDMEQGQDDQGRGLYFQWTAQGEILGYKDAGYNKDYALGLELSQEMAGSGGASGSPVFFPNGQDEYQFAGLYSGNSGSTPMASVLDPESYDWALGIVQEDGYLQDMELLQDPGNVQDSGQDSLESASQLWLQGVSEADNLDLAV